MPLPVAHPPPQAAERNTRLGLPATAGLMGPAAAAAQGPPPAAACLRREGLEPGQLRQFANASRSPPACLPASPICVPACLPACPSPLSSSLPT